MSISRDQSHKKHYDNLDVVCERFMLWLKKEFRGHKSEISPAQLTKRAKRFAIAYGMSDADLIDALLRRKFIEVSAGDTWHLRYDLV